MHGLSGPIRERDRDCRRHTVRVAGPYHQELGEALDDPLLEQIPPEARRSARAAGLEPLILALLKDRQNPGEAPSVEVLALQQRLFVQQISFDSQLQSLLSEVDCTDDVIESLGAQLEQREGNRELSLTLASIGVAAAGAIVAGAWQIKNQRSDGEALVAITSGVGSAALGVAALVPKRHTVEYLHPHNLLAPIASGQDPERLYPTFVRRLLNAPAEPGRPSPREELLATFERKIAKTYPPGEHRRVREILYGAGAIYDQRLIRLREEMYDQLESTLSAFARDFELLSRYLVNLTDPAPPGPSDDD